MRAGCRLFFVWVLLIGTYSASVHALCEATGSATCYYVSPSGSDSNPGTEAQPFYKPMKAVKLARAGDFIYLRGGDYTFAQNYVVGAQSTSCGTPIKKFIELGRVNAAACVSETGAQDTWNAASGTATNPITIKPYPGETAHLAVGQIVIGDLSAPIAYWRLQGFQIESSEIFITGGSKGANNVPVNEPHDIWITDNEIYNRTAAGGTNVGLIKINRGDWGGPYNIFIHRNVLHDLQDSNQPGPWNTTTDWQHFGVVAVESCETYLGANCGGNGRIEIINNTIYNTPAAFFFKNPQQGPVYIYGNTIYNAQNLGKWAAANLVFERNIVYKAGGPPSLGGFGGAQVDSAVAARSGQNITIQYNSYGSGAPGAFKINASGHTIRYNVFTAGMGAMQNANANTGGLYFRDQGDGVAPVFWPDTGGSTVQQSELMTGNTFDYNCIVSAQADPVIVKRFYPTVAYSVPTTVGLVNTDYKLQFFNFTQAQQQFGFDTHSVFINEPNKANIFVDINNGDLHLLNTGPIAACANMGAYAPGGAPPPAPSCGDNTCSASESCSVCPQDCGACPLPKTGDLNNDGVVNILDVQRVVTKLGQNNVLSGEDVNSDGSVNIFDLVTLAQNWG